jgi:Circularly permutated YpsA SLOG family
MTVLPKGGYRQWTRQNVEDSDGTCILYYEALKGGSRLTRNLCALERKPYILVNARETTDPMVAAERILKFVEDSSVEVLNVAGPRASGWAEGYNFALGVIGLVIKKTGAE